MDRLRVLLRSTGKPGPKEPHSGSGDGEQGRLGLLELSSPGSGTSTIVDVVAVHGLNGHRRKTWTAANDQCWLSDFLPLELPQARIMTFGYNSSLTFNKGTATVLDFSLELLDDLDNMRLSVEQQARPIIFISHSLGGIVVKKALILAHEQQHRFGHIVASTKGIIFLGTPHRGSTLADWTRFSRDLIETFPVGPSFVRKDLLKVLETKSKELEEISTSFQHRAMQIMITSFYEREFTPPLKRLVVDKNSSILGYPGEEHLPLDSDHRALCRVETVDSRHWRTLLGAIRRQVKACTPRMEECKEEAPQQSQSSSEASTSMDNSEGASQEEDYTTVSETERTDPPSSATEISTVQEYIPLPATVGISTVPIPELFTFAQKSLLIDPYDCRQYNIAVWKRKRRQKDHTLYHLANLPDLHAWGQSLQPSILSVRGPPRCGRTFRSFAVHTLQLIDDAKIPVVWVLRPRHTDTHSCSTIDAIKQLVYQLLKLKMGRVNEQTLHHVASCFHDNSNDSAEWFNLLGHLISHLPRLYIVVDLEGINHPATEHIGWGRAFSRLLEELKSREIPTLVKVTLLSHRPSNVAEVLPERCVSIILPNSKIPRTPATVTRHKRRSQKYIGFLVH